MASLPTSVPPARYASRGAVHRVLALGVALAALLGLAWWLGGPGLVGPRASGASAQAAETLRGAGALADARDDEGTREALLEPGLGEGEERSPVVAAPEESAAGPATPTRLTGKLQINGVAPFRGVVEMRDESGDWTRTLNIDRYGRFQLDEVPDRRLRLSFRAESSFERPLLLPTVEVTPATGKLEVLDLDWSTRHLNVKVVGDDEWRLARVHMRGPGYDTDFETDETGNARLDLVGAGVFTFRAELATGLVGEAELELEEGDELETVVIVPRSAGG